MHPSAWKGCFPKSEYSILHSRGPTEAGSPPATSWHMECMSTSRGAGWICEDMKKSYAQTDTPRAISTQDYVGRCRIPRRQEGDRPPRSRTLVRTPTL